MCAFHSDTLKKQRWVGRGDELSGDGKSDWRPLTLWIICRHGREPRWMLRASFNDAVSAAVFWQRKLWYWFFFAFFTCCDAVYCLATYEVGGEGLHKCTFKAWREQKHSHALAHCLCSLAALRSPEWLSFGFFNYTAFILSWLRL